MLASLRTTSGVDFVGPDYEHDDVAMQVGWVWGCGWIGRWRGEVSLVGYGCSWEGRARMCLEEGQCGWELGFDCVPCQPALQPHASSVWGSKWAVESNERLNKLTPCSDKKGTPPCTQR